MSGHDKVTQLFRIEHAISSQMTALNKGLLTMINAFKRYYPQSLWLMFCGKFLDIDAPLGIFLPQKLISNFNL